MRRVLAFVALLLGPAGAAAAWPEQPIKVLMPFPPGGTVDVVARLVCAEAGAILGKPLVLDYKPGAAGVIATEAAARAGADGYTILIVTPNHTINPALRKKLPFDTEGDFVPVSLIATVPELLVAHPAAPFDDMAGFLRHARANPGKLNYSSAGIGTLPHITMEALLRRADVKVAHIAYKGAAPAPRGTPAAAVRALSAALAKGVQAPKVVERLRADGVEIGASTPEEFGRLIAAELKLWARVISEAGITASD